MKNRTEMHKAWLTDVKMSESRFFILKTMMRNNWKKNLLSLNHKNLSQNKNKNKKQYFCCDEELIIYGCQVPESEKEAFVVLWFTCQYGNVSLHNLIKKCFLKRQKCPKSLIKRGKRTIFNSASNIANKKKKKKQTKKTLLTSKSWSDR